MTNSQIIISEAIANGIYTKEEVEAILEIMGYDVEITFINRETGERI